MEENSRLKKIMKNIGALPVKLRLRNQQDSRTARRGEVDKLLFRIGVLPYCSGREYLLESVNLGVLFGRY